MARFTAEGGPTALQDRDGRGRPTVWTEPVTRFLEWSLSQPPDALGYASVDWTAELLRHHVAHWMGVDVGDTALREQLHRLGYVWKRPRYVLQPDPDREKKSRIQRQIRQLPERSVVLAMVETDVLLFPPLRATWAKRGPQARVGLTGRNARRVIFGALDLRTGHRVLAVHAGQRAADFCAFLDDLRRRYHDRPVTLLLDRDTSHTVQRSLDRTVTLRIHLLWLPKRSPELKAMDHLWRSPKQKVAANRQDTTIDRVVARFLRYLERLTPRAALRKAGVPSPHFWLHAALSKIHPRPT